MRGSSSGSDRGGGNTRGGKVVVVVVVVVTTVRVLVGAKVNWAMDGSECWVIGRLDRVDEAVFGGDTLLVAAGLALGRVEGRRFMRVSFAAGRADSCVDMSRQLLVEKRTEQTARV
jgi:hypothetical protein